MKGKQMNSINVKALAEQLLGPYAEIRKASRARAADPQLQRDPAWSMDEHREQVLRQLKVLVDQKAVQRAFPKKFGGSMTTEAPSPRSWNLSPRTLHCRSKPACSGVFLPVPSCT